MQDKTIATDFSSLDEEQTFCSLIIDQDRIKNKFIPTTAAIRHGSDDNDSKVSPLIESDELNEKELTLFKKILSRDLNESKYEIVRLVASGGMGHIYSVYDKDIKRYTVLKVIQAEYKEDPNIISRFIFEARISGELEHPNIVPMHDLGYLPGYGIYFTMTFVHGESLFDILKHLKARDPEYIEKYDLYALVGILRKVCDAVAFAHAKNIIHRDIKPENIMVGTFGEVILMDWGIAKRLGDPSIDKLDIETEDIDIDFSDSQEATKDGVIKGTPVYLSPEQALGNSGDVDELSDVFLLGATLYHIFTNKAPFVGANVKDAVERASKNDYAAPEELRPANEFLSGELCHIIRKAMAKNKSDRYQSAMELGKDIDDLLRGKVDFKTVVFEKGEFLVKEGETGSNCYIILSGEAEVYKTVSNEEVKLGTVEKGDIVGEMALIIDEPRTATAVATTTTEAIILNKEIFTHNLKRLPSWMEKSVLALANRLHAANIKYTDTVILNRASIKNH